MGLEGSQQNGRDAVVVRGTCECRSVLTSRYLDNRLGVPKGNEVKSSHDCFDAADIGHDPSKVARDARKARIAKNDRQRQQNLARTAGQQSAGASTSATSAPQRKMEIDRTLATTRTSTASMGRFDRSLEGEKKLRGVKRKVRGFPAYFPLAHN